MNKKTKEKVLKGMSASPGIAIGTPFFYVHETLNISRESIADHDIEKEIVKYKTSLEAVRQKVLEDKANAMKRGGAEAAKIFDSHLMIVNDQVLTDEVIYFISAHNVKSSYAVSKVMTDYQTAFEKIKNQYFSQRAVDIEDVCRRIVKELISEIKQTGSQGTIKGKQIVISDNIFPSDTLNFNKDHLLGIITEFGGITSHAAILSRALEVPAIVGVKSLSKWIRNAALIILDGYAGKVIINPKPSTFEKYKIRQHEDEKQIEEDLKYSSLPSVTEDGQAIRIASNIQSSKEADNAIRWNCDGVGLFRTEFLFKSSQSVLSEDEQFKVYDEVAEKIYPKHVVIRILDIGGDKLDEKIAVKEDNPFLGERGMRLLFNRPGILKSHLRAIIRASSRKNVSILIPFIANITEIKKTSAIIGKVKKELLNEGYKIDDKIKTGVMIEIPSAAIIADSISKHADFFSIGTNDLTQYTLAADRDNEKVSGIYDSFHPAVIRLIDMTVKAAKKNKIETSICGQMGGYPLAIPLLLGLGLREFSVTPFLVPSVKKIIRRLDTKECKELAKRCLKVGTSRAVSVILSDFFEKKIGNNPLQ
ncbi:MAG: phosphoenolpyruvate--protein phosphotransferase [Candidatus Delongbacteria bacterium]